MRKYIILLIYVVFIANLSYSQNIKKFLPEGNYSLNAAIPSPEDYLGFKLGDFHASNDQVTAYMKLLSEKSDRVKFKQIGTSYEGRPIIFLIITSNNNIENLEQIRLNNLKLTDPNISGSLNIENMPIVLWLGYSVHGNEASGANASMAVAYYLAAAQGKEIDNILKNSVIIIQPNQNPDGIQRFADWANSARSFANVTDMYSREFREPSPSSRTNHYWFDLNRDWLWVQHPETYNRLALYKEWHPTVVNDYHEQNSTNGTYFSPGIKNSTNPLIPEMNRKLTEEIAKYHSQILDKNGVVYFSKEEYDNFYTGKGAAYPDLLGSIGILYEQPSSRGYMQIKNGVLLKFSDIIRYQSLCSYSAINAGVDKRVELNKYKADFYKESAELAKKGNIKGYLIDFALNFSLKNELISILTAHNISIYNLQKDIVLNGKEFKKVSCAILPLQQKEYRVIRTMFDKIPEYRDTTFYDITAWTLPQAMNLNYEEISYVDGLIGEKANLVTNIYEKPIFSKIGYLLDIKDQYSYSVVYKLQKSGLQLRVCDSKFRIVIGSEETEFKPGTVFIPVMSQNCSPEDVLKIIIESNANSMSKIVGVTSSSGVEFDLGSPHFRTFNIPKIAIITGKGASYGSIGEIWHLLDQKYSISASILDSSNLSDTELSNYNTIILNGNYKFTKDLNDKLRDWTSRSGNKIIAIDQSYQTINEIGISDIKILTSIKGNIEGIILKAKSDKITPLLYGVTGNEVNLFKIGRILPELPNDLNNITLKYSKNPLVAGYINDNLLDKISGIPAVISGNRFIYFADNPDFRGYWYGTARLFMNSIFFREVFQTGRVILN